MKRSPRLFLRVPPSPRTPSVTSTPRTEGDRKSTRLNSSHGYISYAVFCLKKKKKIHETVRFHSKQQRHPYQYDSNNLYIYGLHPLHYHYTHNSHAPHSHLFHAESTTSPAR